MVDKVIVEFLSDPEGAEVHFDGSLLCPSTSAGCVKAVPIGQHAVLMKKAKYSDKSEQVQIKKGIKVSFKLETNFAFLSLSTVPSGLEIILDSKKIGKSPIKGYEVTPGTHEVRVQDPCHAELVNSIQVQRGQTLATELALKPREAQIQVLAQDGTNRAIEAEVLLDDRAVGTTPFTSKVSMCAKKLEVRSKGLGSFTKELALQETTPTEIMATLKADGAAISGVSWVKSQSTKVLFSKSEITLSQYLACVQAKGCTKPGDKTANKDCNAGYADRSSHPVNCIDWGQADAFCSWAGGRLPSANEWVAEASGKGSRVYPWGQQPATCDYAIWGNGEKNKDGCDKESTWPVCSKPKGNSPSGLCDMSGNVWEWTGSSSGQTAVLIMGGSWSSDDPEAMKATTQASRDPLKWSHIIGVRCVKEPK